MDGDRSDIGGGTVRVVCILLVCMKILHINVRDVVVCQTAELLRVVLCCFLSFLPTFGKSKMLYSAHQGYY